MAEAEVITRVEMRYQRVTRIKTKMDPPGCVVWDYRERLLVDGGSETIELWCRIGEECAVTHRYEIGGGVSELLAGLGPEALTRAGGDPPDGVEDPAETKDYELRVATASGERVLSGRFDRNGLPADWDGFIRSVRGFLQFYAPGEIFDSALYAAPRRRASDLCFCRVVFEGSDREYTYLAEGGEYQVDDQVVVPVGPENKESAARIVDVEYRQAEDAPYPMDKIKRILRPYEAGCAETQE